MGGSETLQSYLRHRSLVSSNFTCTRLTTSIVGCRLMEMSCKYKTFLGNVVQLFQRGQSAGIIGLIAVRFNVILWAMLKMYSPWSLENRQATNTSWSSCRFGCHSTLTVSLISPTCTMSVCLWLIMMYGYLAMTNIAVDKRTLKCECAQVPQDQYFSLVVESWMICSSALLSHKHVSATTRLVGRMGAESLTTGSISVCPWVLP